MHLAVSGLLEIEDVEGFGRVCNDVGSFLGVLGEGALLEEGGDSAERSDIGAGGQKLQKFATGVWTSSACGHSQFPGTR